MLAFLFTIDRVRQATAWILSLLGKQKKREDGTDSVTPLWNYFSLEFRLSSPSPPPRRLVAGRRLQLNCVTHFLRKRERERMTAKEKEGFPLMDATLPYAVRRSSLPSHRWPNMVNCCCFRFEIKESWETLTTNYEYGIAKKGAVSSCRILHSVLRTTHTFRGFLNKEWNYCLPTKMN